MNGGDKAMSKEKDKQNPQTGVSIDKSQGHCIQKSVVVGSNPTPPATALTHHLSEFENWLCQGRTRQTTAKGYRKMIWLLSKIGDIEQPQKIRAIISIAQVSEGRKQLLANAYDYYCQFKELQWEKPRFIREDKPFFLAQTLRVLTIPERDGNRQR